ncbi:cupredoxin domain-containing protein [Haloplanus salinarum]|uniref:cupredoxin domain-containing protein n=1 Tax=Haloplanus salinarum TaxID=1912324 RepID=UPI00214B6EAA|nr:plastocyanin/azurin family copper-binding protein [Haloplanus salinarum]
MLINDIDRRTLLRLGGAAAIGALAGCNSQQGSDATSTATTTPTSTATSTATATEASGTNPLGADQLGGPDDLQSSATVEATMLSSDQGAGQHVNTPAVVWVEQGATVTWNIAEGSHSITAYHPDFDRSLRIPEGATSFDSGILSAGESFEHTFDTPGVYNYFCRPHEGLGMVGLVVVGQPQGGPGTTAVDDIELSAAAQSLTRLLDVAGIVTSEGGGANAYAWQDATWDSYWYSLYNMSTNIAMSGNGVQFPHNEEQQQAFDQRVPGMLQHADVDKPPIKNPNLNMAAFTEGDPHFTQQPVFDSGDGRPDAATLTWDMSKSSKVVSPSSVAWTHLKGVTWAKNFQKHFETLPPGIAAKFRAQMLTTLAQIGTNATLIAGGPDGNGALTKGDSLELVSEFRPSDGTVVDETSRPNHHSAMLWFLSDLTSLAGNGWFGYVNPEPLIPNGKIQQLTDGMAQTTMNLFDPSDVVEMGSTRDLGQMLGAVGWYGTHAGGDDLRAAAASYADDLAAEVDAHLEGNGYVADGAANGAATQGAVGQGLLWASQIDGVDHRDTAESVLGYLLDELWDEDAGTFATSPDASTYRITSRDAGDVTGGLNAADALLDLDVQAVYARYFNGTFNRGRLQRAERPNSRDEGAEFTLPLPPAAGGEYGQAAVYNDAVEYDTGADEWTVVDDTFTTAWALYTANQDIWIGNWAGDFFQGRGVPGRSDQPPEGA